MCSLLVGRSVCSIGASDVAMLGMVCIVVGFTCIVSLGYADPEWPEDVATFKERRDLCDHFRGEEPYNAERRGFLAERVRTYCTGTDRELARLKAKYKDDDVVNAILGRYEEVIEAGQ